MHVYGYDGYDLPKYQNIHAGCYQRGLHPYRESKWPFPLSVILKHALKNALIPILTVVGMQVRTAIGGALIIERVFNIPGLGMLATDSVIARDYQVVMFCVMIMGVFTIVTNMIVDILYGIVDPRIKFESR